MNIHHITALDNVVNGRIVDPKLTKHGVITARKVSDLSGWIDPVTHLNLDFFEHIMRYAIVAEKLELGSEMALPGDVVAMKNNRLISVRVSSASKPIRRTPQRLPAICRGSTDSMIQP